MAQSRKYRSGPSRGAFDPSRSKDGAGGSELENETIERSSESAAGGTLAGGPVEVEVACDTCVKRDLQQLSESMVVQ